MSAEVGAIEAGHLHFRNYQVYWAGMLASKFQALVTIGGRKNEMPILLHE